MGACVSKKTEQLLTCGRNGSKITPAVRHDQSHLLTGGYEKQISGSQGHVEPDSFLYVQIYLVFSFNVFIVSEGLLLFPLV